VEANTAPAVAGVNSGNTQQGIGAIAFSGKWLSRRYQFKETSVSLSCRYAHNVSTSLLSWT
jgi:hypothetical protein